MDNMILQPYNIDKLGFMDKNCLKKEIEESCMLEEKINICKVFICCIFMLHVVRL